MKIYIYVLTEPDGVTIRYVGKSNEFRIKKRLTEHCRLSQMKHKTHKNHWIKSLLSKEIRPILNIVEECTEENFREREKYYVNFYKSQGFDLTNSTEGGEGAIRIANRKISKEQRKKIGETWKKHPNMLAICSNGGKANRGIKRKFAFDQTSRHVGINRMSDINVNGNVKERWRAYLYANGKQIHIGVYPTEFDACNARETKRIELGL